MTPRRCAILALLLSPVLGAVGSRPSEAAPAVGHHVPSFELEDLYGKKFPSARLRGRVAVLVVGRTRKAAPPCKEWVLGLIQRHGTSLPVYQIIVVDKAWYVPRKAVIGSVKDFTPPSFHHRVLLEWYTVFADLYGIARHDDPVVLVIGPDGVLRLKLQGPVSEAGFKRVAEVLRSHGGTANR